MLGILFCVICSPIWANCGLICDIFLPRLPRDIDMDVSGGKSHKCKDWNANANGNTLSARHNEMPVTKGLHSQSRAIVLGLFTILEGAGARQRESLMPQTAWPIHWFFFDGAPDIDIAGAPLRKSQSALNELKLAWTISCVTYLHFHFDDFPPGNPIREVLLALCPPEDRCRKLVVVLKPEMCYFKIEL